MESETTAALGYRLRTRRGPRTVNNREPATCGSCGLCFEQIPARDDGTDHPLHGACPRCGEQDNVGERTG